MSLEKLQCILSHKKLRTCSRVVYSILLNIGTQFQNVLGFFTNYVLQLFKNISPEFLG